MSPPKKHLYKVCAACGRKFGGSKPSRWKNQKYCSAACRGLGQSVFMPEKFWQKVAKAGDDECWEWTGAKNGQGYGNFSTGRKGKTWLAHRLAWALLNGNIPQGLQIIHSCDNPGCVNPRHLRLGTQKDNMDDCIKRGRRPLGEKRPNSVLTASQVPNIFRDKENGMSYRTLSEKYGVSPSAIWGVLSGKCWAWVDVPKQGGDRLRKMREHRADNRKQSDRTTNGD